MGVFRGFWQRFVPICVVMNGLMEIPAFAGMTFLRWDDGGFFRHTGAGTSPRRRPEPVSQGFSCLLGDLSPALEITEWYSYRYS
jgi:hypothetical protein